MPPRTAWPEGGIQKTNHPSLPYRHSFSSPTDYIRYALPSFRVDSFPRTSSQRELVDGMFPEESGSGSGRRARYVYGRSIKAISEHIHPADLLQARAAVASRACKVDWPKKSISESDF